jgi:hypothetical protein
LINRGAFASARYLYAHAPQYDERVNLAQRRSTTYLDVLHLQQRRVRNDDDCDLLLVRKVERRPSTIAVSDCGDPGDAACLERS